MLTRADFRKYQDRALAFVLAHPICGLFLDMGLGKTIIVLTAIMEFIRRKQATRFLVIGPIRVVETVWRQEAKKWKHTQPIVFSLVRGTPKQRNAALRAKAHVYLINPENVVWLINWMRKHGCPFDGLVVDESSMFKSPSTKRWKALKLALGMFKVRIIMTGTPTPNSLMELWAQIFLLDEGTRLGTGFGRFKERHFSVPHQNSYNYQPREGAQEAILEAIGDIILRLDARDWLDVPKIVKNRIDLDLPAEVMDVYEEFEREMFVRIDEIDQDLEAFNAATLSMRCHQIANGGVYVLDEDNVKTGEYTVLHEVKMEALKEIIEETGDNIIIAYHFKHDLARLREEFPDAPFLGGGQKEKTEAIRRRWKAGRIPILLAHPRSASHGLNDMQLGGHTIVFFSLTWSLENHDQLIARISGARATEKADIPILVHYLVAKNTVDEALMSALRSKNRGQRATLNALREYKDGYIDILS